MDSDIITIVAICVVCAFVSAWIGEKKGRRSDGFILGLLFGPLGLIITICMADIRGEVCRICKKKNPKGVSFCAHCGTSFSDDLSVECPYCKREFKVTT